MADLTIWCAPIGGRFPGDTTAQPVMAFPGVSGGISRTLTGLASSTQSIAMPDFGSRYSFVTVTASGGDVWIAVGANPTAVANANNALRIPSGSAISGFVLVGDKIAAIAG